MSSRGWLRNVAVWGCIAAIFCASLSVNVLAQPVGDDPGSQPGFAQAQQQAKSDNTPLILDAIKSEIERIRRATEALKDQSDPKQKEERERRDLVAQEEMAFWANALFWTACASVFLTLVGLAMILGALIYTKRASESAAAIVIEGEKATKAALETAAEAKRQAHVFEQSFKRLDRPYVFFEVVETTGLRNEREEHPFLTYQLVNRGKLAAVIRSVSIGLLDSPQFPLAVPDNKDTRHFVVAAGGGLPMPQKLTVTDRRGKQYAGREGAKLVVYGQIEYDDPTGAHHTDSFCMRGMTDAKHFALEGGDDYNWRKTEYSLQPQQ
jgi:hypothetical protein